MGKGLQRRGPGLALVLLTAFLLFHTPDGGRLQRAPSPSALWVGHHSGLGARLPELMSQPVPRAIAFAAGMDEDELADITDDPASRFWMQHLLPGEGLLIHEPHVGPVGEKSWVAISRVGWRQFHLRLLSELGLLKRWERAGTYQGRSLWRRVSKKKRTPWVLALHEGYLVAVRHADPRVLEEVLDRLDGRLPNLDRARADYRHWRESPRSAKDEGFWLGNPRLPQTFTLAVDREPELRFRVAGPAVDTWFSAEPEESTRRFAARLAGPQVLAAVTPPAPFVPGGGQLLLLAPPYTTVVSLIGVPSLLWVAPAKNREDAFARAREGMASLGALFGERWKEDRSDPDRLRFQLRDPPRAFLLGERSLPTAVYLDQHLVLAFGRQTLDRLLLRYRREEAAFEERDVLWNLPRHVAWMNLQDSLRIAQPLVQLFSLRDAMGAAGASTGKNTERASRVLKSLESIRLVRIAKEEKTLAEKMELVLYISSF